MRYNRPSVIGTKSLQTLIYIMRPFKISLAVNEGYGLTIRAIIKGNRS